ncbi:hypothetical protein DRO37_00080 [Candidatus Bathyarchaeota archaeon]|nr:MAG: hypothetical protein DRO37_00080 [Candidatus Bathyarchaeota archaeon]
MAVKFDKRLTAIVVAALLVSSIMVILLRLPQPPYRPKRIKYVYVIFTSHIDVGYVHPMDEVEDWIKRIIDDAIDACMAYPEFKWTIENVWELESWLRRTKDPKKVELLLDLIRDGRIEVGAAWDDVYTGLLGYEDINRLFYPGKVLQKMYNISMSTAIMNDLPGYSWGLPQAMNRSGIKYFLTGINYFKDYWRSGTSIPRGHLPFYWEGPDGSRVLTWISFGGYWEGECCTDDPPQWWLNHPKYEKMRSQVRKMVYRWENIHNYPYDALLVMFAHDYANSSWPINALRNIRRWNKEGNNPKIIVATPSEFFSYMEKKYKGNFKVYSGDWTADWNLNKQRVYPWGTAAYRWTRDHLTVAEKIWSINTILYNAAYPKEEFSDIYRLLFTWLDHTESPHSGKHKFTEEEMRRDITARNELILSSYRRIRSLLDAGFKLLLSGIEASGSSIVVFNPLSWMRTDIVTLKLNDSLLSGDFQIIDSTSGLSIPCQIDLQESTVTFIAENVPPIGYKKFDIVWVKAPPLPNRVSASGNILENEFFRVTVDPNDGSIVSIVDKETGRELVNKASNYRFNQLWSSSGGKHEAVSSGDVRLRAVSGPVMGKIIVEHTGSPFLRSEYILYSGIKRLKIKNVLNRTALGSARIGDAIYYYVTFPFNLSIEKTYLRTEMANHFLLWSGEDHLPGAYRNHFLNQHCFDLNEAESYGVTIGTKETYANTFVQAGLHGWVRDWAPSEATWINTLLMVKDQYYTTDHGWISFDWEPDAGETLTYQYSIWSYSGPFNPINASRLGWEFNVPLMAGIVLEGQSGPLKSPVMSFLNVDRKNVQIVTVKMAEFGKAGEFIVRLQEISGDEGTVRLYSFVPVEEARLVSITEDDAGISIPADNLKFTIHPHETVTVKIVFADAQKKIKSALGDCDS